jgi:hypothetical protein
LITAALSQFDSSTADTVLLEKEAGDIGNELGRREALAAGRTFTPDAIEKMRQYFIKNTKKPKPSNCIDTMNEGLRLLYGDKKQSGGDSVDKTMAALQAANRAGQARVKGTEAHDPRRGQAARPARRSPCRTSTSHNVM